MKVSTVNGILVVVVVMVVVPAVGDVLNALDGSLLDVIGRFETGFLVAVTTLLVGGVLLLILGVSAIFCVESF